jgi:hypothetical protein
VLAIRNFSRAFRWFGFILAVLAAARAGAAIDFTPTTGERVLEGIVFKQLIFHENGRRITYEQPRGWKYSGEAARIRFTPSEFGQAQAEITQSPLTDPASFNDAAITRLRTGVLASIPPGSQNAVIVVEEQNPISINGQQTYAVTVGYKLSGQDYRLGTIFVNLQDTQLQFRVIAKKDDFEKVNRLFRGSLISLQWH